jgi:hypothetical protein
MLAELPQIIYQAKGGDYSALSSMLGLLIAQDSVMSPGMQYSVQCNEERSFTNEKDYQAAIAKYPELAPYYDDATNFGFAVCAGWGAGKAAAIENQPVTSNLPTLVMSGEYDPVTPPAWGKRVAQTLSKSYVFEYPATGHGASLDSVCATGMMLTFIKDPSKAPDSACIAKMTAPAWVVPGSAAAIKLVPYTDDVMGYTSVVPEDWEEGDNGLFSRGASISDQTAIVQLSGTGANSQTVAKAILTSLGTGDLPKATTQYKSTRFTWQVYRVETTVQGQKWILSLGLADAAGRAYIVVLITSPDETDALYKSVFIPVLEAMHETP